MMVIPTQRAADENIFYMMVTGPSVDAEKAGVDKEYFFTCARRLSSKPDLQFGDAKSLYSYK